MIAAATFERFVDGLLSRSPAQALFARHSRRMLAVLAYHGVDDRERFAEQMDYVATELTPVGLDEVADFVGGRRQPPEQAVLITFDDADRSILEVALPILRERQLPGVAFVVTELLDSTEPFWWEEAEELFRAGGTAPCLAGVITAEDAVRRLKRVEDDERRAALELLRASAARGARPRRHLRRADLVTLERGGLRVGNHTATHPCLDRCDKGRIAEELATSHEALTSVLGRAPDSFAYPNGNHDDRAGELLAELGYQTAFVFDHRHARVPCSPYRISRLRVNSDTSLDRFRIIVSGLHPALHRLRTTLSPSVSRPVAEGP